MEDIKYTVDDEEHSLTPLLPLKQEILQYFSPQELIKRLRIKPATIGNQSGGKVKLTLPLSGDEYTIFQDYAIQQDHAITAIPFLEIWPNFKAPNWKEYYTFYFDDRTAATKEKKIFRAVFPEAQEVQPPQGEIRDYQLNRLESFPDYIICQEETGATQGLILLKTPPTVGDGNPRKTWTVGVDFGTFFTNVYYKRDRYRSVLTLSPLNQQVTQQISRQGLLYDHFMSGKAEKFPLSSILTIKGSREQERPVFDGRVYIPEDLLAFNPYEDDIKTELKWNRENLPSNRTFLQHLALLITAEAAKNDVRKIQWSISYPSAFSRNDKNFYQVTWERIIDGLGARTGLEHNWLPQGNPYRSESLVMAQYVSSLGNNLLNTTCIDMGGGSSDISIWQKNHLIHQCSVQLAGRLLFCQFLIQKPDFLNQQFNPDMSDLSENLQDDDPFFVKLEAILAKEGKEWLEKNRALMDDDSDLQEIVQLSILGISGLYYYIGLVLKGLNLKGKHEKQENTLVYIGGNGSRILNWLDMSGTFTPECEAAVLLSYMFSRASGYEDRQEETSLSTQPKAEVACGLVLDQNKTRLTGLEKEDEDMFAGEDCIVNGQPIKWCDRLNLMQFENIDTFTVNSLRNLKQFLDDFHEALKEKRILNIKPLEHYENKKWLERLWRDVDHNVEAQLTKMMGRKAEDIRPKPPFIIGLKALLKQLSDKMNK